MKKNIENLIKHISEHPNDANAKINLLRIQGENVLYDYDLEAKRKREKMLSIKRKELKQ